MGLPVKPESQSQSEDSTRPFIKERDMLHANELMLGDWLRLRYTENGKEVVKDFQVDQIRRLSTDSEDVYVWSRDGGNMGLVEKMEPIPITKEILEKNGFRFDGSGQRSMMLATPFGESGTRWNIYVGLKHKTIDVFSAPPEEKYPNWRKCNKVYLEVCGCFVHELQHCLKLSGIDKEIVL